MSVRTERTKTKKIRQYIIDHVTESPQDITKKVANEFAISRQAAHYHVHKLVLEGILIAQGNSNSRSYKLAAYVDAVFMLELSPELQEDVVWSGALAPLLSDLPANLRTICEYGLTEILNNAIDHSEGTEVYIYVYYSRTKLRLTVSDNGIGIFRKIQRELHLADPRLALLELAKGKLTTDPARHTGEGIFFTSRAFDRFTILSYDIAFLHGETDNDWLIGDSDGSDIGEDTHKGTYVAMEIKPDSPRDLVEVFNTYASPESDYGFTRTIVPVALAKVGNENLLSRSQAKRLLARFDRFKEVILDFKDVDFIGQAFADEIFRVHQNRFPDVHIVPINASEVVMNMIQRALTNRQETPTE
jgi:anti-sigma regulatory factor (Ser/Thr protein kinase)